MKDRLNKHRSIARHIIDGTITIDSVSEFESMLHIFPDNAALHAAFADLLVKKKMPDAAAKSYSRAAELYIGSEMMLPAILAKILAWRIQKPPHQEARQLFSNLRKSNFPDTPLRTFFNSLSYPELVAITNRMARICMPSGQVIRKIGDEEAALYFIATGAVRDTIYKPIERDENSQQKHSVYLTANDVFGDIYPFEEEKLSQSYTETISSVELAKISKERLKEACNKYPNVARALVNLLKAEPKDTRNDTGRGLRIAGRHPLPIKMNLEIYPDGSDDSPLVLQGYSRDISVGGVCVVVDAKYTNITKLLKSLINSKIRVCFPGEAMTLNVDGNVVWSKKVLFEGENTLALGIQFKDLTPKMSGMLIVFAEMLYESR